MTQPHFKKIRVSSARYPSTRPEKSRPFSGRINASFAKKEVLEQIYGVKITLPTRGSSAYRQNLPPKNISCDLQNDKEQQQTIPKQCEEKEQMEQQTFHLKQNVNKLEKQLSLERRKVEVIKQRHGKQISQPTRGNSACRPYLPPKNIARDLQSDKEHYQTLPYQIKEKEEMEQQAFHLKQNINKLEKQLSFERGKVVAIKQMYSKYSKLLCAYFEDQKQWGSQTVSNHLITGIKTVNHNLKQQLQNKCHEYNDLLSKIRSTDYLEMQNYIQILQKNNMQLMQLYKQLNKQLQECKEHKKQSKLISTEYEEIKNYIKALQKFKWYLNKSVQKYKEHKKQLSISRQAGDSAQYILINTLTDEEQRLNEKLEQAQKAKKDRAQQLIDELTKENEQLEQLRQTKKDQAKIIKDLEKKVLYFVKLIVQKDNNIHDFEKKNKKLDKENSKLKQDNNQLKLKYQKSQKQKIDERAAAQRLETDLKSAHAAELQNLKKAKDSIIHNLEKNNTFHQKMLIESRKNNTQLNTELSRLKEQKVKQSLSLRNSTHQTIQKQQSKRQEELITSLFNSYSPSGQVSVVRDGSGNRIPQKANKKHHEQSLKKRKVQPLQIAQIADLARLKLVAQNIFLDQLMDKFNYNASQCSQQDQQWAQEYITMKETISILSRQPLNLNNENSILLARYLIQDVHQEYVYCDMLNENHREVVKSIVRSLIKQYQMSTASEPQVADIMYQYGENIKSALKTIERSGLISRTKFENTLTSLGIEMSVNAKECLLAKMALKAQSINKLPYDVLF